MNEFIVAHQTAIRLTFFRAVLGAMIVWERISPRLMLSVGRWGRWLSNLSLGALNTLPPVSFFRSPPPESPRGRLDQLLIQPFPKALVLAGIHPLKVPYEKTAGEVPAAFPWGPLRFLLSHSLSEQ